MKIIFDFDNTLFYEEPFVAKIRGAFQACGVAGEIYDATKQEAYEGNIWRQFRHMDLLAAQSRIPLRHLQVALDSIIEAAHTFLYPDVEPFLRRMPKTCPTAILTFGDERFQRMKVEGAGIWGFFQDIIITQNIWKDMDANLLSKGEPALFVEDNPRALEAVKAYAPHITTVRMRRGHGKYADMPSGKGIDYEITRIDELETFLL